MTITFAGGHKACVDLPYAHPSQLQYYVYLLQQDHTIRLLLTFILETVPDRELIYILNFLFIGYGLLINCKDKLIFGEFLHIIVLTRPFLIMQTYT